MIRNQKVSKGLKVTLVEVVVTTLEDVVSIAEVVVSIEKEEDGIQDVKEVIIPISTLVEVEVEVEVIIPTKI